MSWAGPAGELSFSLFSFNGAGPGGGLLETFFGSGLFFRKKEGKVKLVSISTK